MNHLIGKNNIMGRVRAHRVHPLRIEDRWEPVTGWNLNEVMYGWGAAAARVLTGITAGNYRISGMLMEYQNVASPSDTVDPPAFDRSGGIGYYNGLSSSPDTDYLRVPLVSASLGNSDPSLFDDVNQMTFFAMSQGVGVHGKPFSDVNNSLVYGGGLAAIVDLGDPTQDIVFSRFYLPTNAQQLKLSTSLVGLEWSIALV